MKTESSLFDRAARAVGALTGVTIQKPVWWPDKPQARIADGVVWLSRGEHKAKRVFVVKAAINPAVLQLLALWRRDEPNGLLLVTRQVSDRQADILRQAGVDFLDEAGNVSISDPALFLLVTGRRAPPRQPGSVKPRAFHLGGLKLLYALLTDPKLDDPQPYAALIGRTYRDIGIATGLAHSTVGWIMADLIRLGRVMDVEPGVRTLSGRTRILERWVQGYLEDLRPRLVLARYRPAQVDWWKDAELDGGLWSGEVAEAKLTGTLKPGAVTIFGPAPSHSFVLRHRLQKDAQGTVEFLTTFWRRDAAPGVASSCVHPLLVYADLLAIDDDRTREAAQAIYDHHLRSIIETS